ncbi:hypothetical protein F5879DRAFT_996169 [Lentinula edodes]|nr:hypothetical protein F5879DRAFT_996169 [Lentinula edodes]
MAQYSFKNLHKFDPIHINTAWKLVVSRHQSLQTNFVIASELESSIIQVILKAGQFNLPWNYKAFESDLDMDKAAQDATNQFLKFMQWCNFFNPSHFDPTAAPPATKVSALVAGGWRRSAKPVFLAKALGSAGICSHTLAKYPRFADWQTPLDLFILSSPPKRHLPAVTASPSSGKTTIAKILFRS